MNEGDEPFGGKRVPYPVKMSGRDIVLRHEGRRHEDSAKAARGQPSNLVDCRVGRLQWQHTDGQEAGAAGGRRHCGTGLPPGVPGSAPRSIVVAFAPLPQGIDPIHPGDRRGSHALEQYEGGGGVHQGGGTRPGGFGSATHRKLQAGAIHLYWATHYSGGGYARVRPGHQRRHRHRG